MSALELRLRHRVLAARRDRAAVARLRPPQPLDVLLREDHRGVESDHREAPGDVEDRLDHGLADVGPEVVELGGVVPREARAVVAVVDVAPLAGRPCRAARRRRPRRCRPSSGPRSGSRPGRRSARFSPPNVYAGNGGSPTEMNRSGCSIDPARVDAHVVGDHVAREADAAGRGPVAEDRVGGVAAEVVGDPVVVEGVGARDRLLVAAPALDRLRRPRALPQPDQPEPGDPAPGERVQLLVGDRVERPDVAAVAARELVEPDVRALRERGRSGASSRGRR